MFFQPLLSLTGLDLLMEGLHGEECDYKRLEAWLPSITNFFITDIKLYDEVQLDEKEQKYVNFVNIILKHLMWGDVTLTLLYSICPVILGRLRG